MNPPIFTLITAAVNETTELENLISTIYETCNLNQIGEFIIIYSRKSPSDYPEFLEGLKKNFPLIEFVTIEQTGSGLSNAVIEAYNHARFSHIIGFAADGNNDPEDIHKIMNCALENPDKIVTTSRRLHKNGFSAYSLPKKIANDFFFLLLRIVFRSKQTDITYFFECLPAEYYRKFCTGYKGKNIVAHICLLPELYGVEFIEIPSKLSKNAIEKQTNLGMKYYLATIEGIVTPLIRKTFKKR